MEILPVTPVHVFCMFFILCRIDVAHLAKFTNICLCLRYYYSIAKTKKETKVPPFPKKFFLLRHKAIRKARPFSIGVPGQNFAALPARPCKNDRLQPSTRQTPCFFFDRRLRFSVVFRRFLPRSGTTSKSRLGRPFFEMKKRKQKK